MRWAYFIEWAAWWLVKDDGATAERLFGPFRTPEEVEAASRVHGMPAPAGAAA